MPHVVLVTGASGFVGSHLVPELRRRGSTVVTIDRHISQTHGAEQYGGDIVASEVLSQVSEAVDTVVHLAADVDIGVGPQCFVDNVYGTFRVAQWADARAIKKLLYISSAAVFDTTEDGTPADEGSTIAPASTYGMSKYLGECALRACRTPSIVLRFPYLYGPGDGKSTLAELMRAITARRHPSVRDERRDYLFIRDAVGAIIRALEYRGTYDTFNVGTGTQTSMRDIAVAIANLQSASVSPTVTGFRNNVVLDSRLALRELGWRPHTTLAEGLSAQLLSLQ